MRTRRSTSRADDPNQLWLFPSLTALRGQRADGDPSRADAANDTATATDSPPEAASVAMERLVTIPSGEPFLSTLARAILDGTLTGERAASTGPLDLSRITLLLPTRRATRALQDAFLAASSVRAVLLPTIRPIAEADEDLSLITGFAGGTAETINLEIPPAISNLERQLVLTSLVMRWSAAMRASGSSAAAGAGTPAQAANLARELARLIDMVETEKITLDGLAALVREEFSEHWQQTLDFLEIVTHWWPAHLAEAGLISPADRRNRTILAEARRLERTRPADPVIVAGVTGSIPATVDLMRAVAELPRGAIVLPGLDLDLDEPSWQAITGGSGMPAHAEHPQFGLKTLLDRLGVGRADVAKLSRLGDGRSSARDDRARLVSEAMRPSATTARWFDVLAAADRTEAERAFAGVSLIEAPSAQDEAEAIALILREVAETPGKTGALISPDRLLARRVGIRLEAWGIRVDDSAGRPLRKTPPGAVLDLALDTVAGDFAAKHVVTLTKHPLVRLGLDPFVIRRAARALELIAFRGPYLGRGIEGIRLAIDAAERDCTVGPESRGSRRPRAVVRLFDDDWIGARMLVDRLEMVFAPLVQLFQSNNPQPLETLVTAHVSVALALADDGAAATATERGEPAPTNPLWQEDAGVATKALLEGLTRPDLPAPAIAAADYPDFYRALVVAETVRPQVPRHPRLFIWGPLEARLQQPDVVVLGSLNDGTWPEAADPGPWLNRPMRAAMKLPAPEEKLGYAAHDFTMALGAERVFLTRAEKIDGVPTVPSRWLMRLEALLGGIGAAETLRRPCAGVDGAPATYLGWARQRDDAGPVTPVERPAPRPPVDARPRRLSVSAVETWIANPYAIFAGHILRLEALPRLGAAPDASVRGGLLHEALARFVKAHPAALPADIEAALMRHAGDVFTDWAGHPRVAAFWLPRLARFANWFADTEPQRRAGIATVMAEMSGQMQLGSPERRFTLTARADRLDVRDDGGLVITDYKTGTPPKEKEVIAGRRPQLPLEAAIALARGFATLAPSAIAGLRYIRASGGEPPGEETMLKAPDLAGLVNTTLAGLERHIARFDDPETPYLVTRRKRFSYDFDPFAQLARVAEWSGTAEADAEIEDAG